MPDVQAQQEQMSFLADKHKVMPTGRNTQFVHPSELNIKHYQLSKEKSTH